MANTTINYNDILFYDWEGRLMNGYSRRMAIEQHRIEWANNSDIRICADCESRLRPGTAHMEDCTVTIAIWDEDLEFGYPDNDYDSDNDMQFMQNP